MSNNASTGANATDPTTEARKRLDAGKQGSTDLSFGYIEGSAQFGEDVAMLLEVTAPPLIPLAIADALLFSRNYAEASLYVTKTAAMHIKGLCDLLEKTAAAIPVTTELTGSANGLFWGWGPNRDGQNMLGKLWMEVRSELRAKAPGSRA